MRSRVLVRCTFILLLLGVSGICQATTIVDLYGDKDGFGTGIIEGAHGAWNTISMVSSGNEGITDQKVSGTQVWTHTFDITDLGTIQSASIEIFALGQGIRDLMVLKADSGYIGTLTDGDSDSDPSVLYISNNSAHKDTFSLTSFGAITDGILDISVGSRDSRDEWAIDYCELTITYTPAPVPEPATMLLFGIGLLCFAGVSRRK